MTVKPTISTDDRAIQCAALALDKKAYNVKVLDIRGISTIADYLVIATGTSDKQVVAIADSVRSGLKKYGKMIDMEGAKEGKWVVMDYGDVLVHVFLEEFRRYYDLDDLWSAAKVTEIPAEYLWEGKGE
ncbi:MAG: ribosome silencing factor [Geobacteraceae bacterium]|nr:ribosome silencing factor [Geobacteraceae bacterium]